MAAWFDDNLEAITRRFIELNVVEERQAAVEKERVKQVENRESPTSDSEMSGTLWQQLDDAKQPGAHPKSTTDTSRDEDAPSATTARSDTSRPAMAKVPAGDDASRRTDSPDRT